MHRKILIGIDFLSIQGRVKKISKIFDKPPPEIALHYCLILWITYYEPNIDIIANNTRSFHLTPSKIVTGKTSVISSDIDIREPKNLNNNIAKIILGVTFYSQYFLNSDIDIRAQINLNIELAIFSSSPKLVLKVTFYSQHP